MRLYIATLALPVLLSATACRPATPAFSPDQADAVRDSVTAAVERFRQLAESGQWDSVGTLYSDATGFRFAESGAFQYGSAADVRAALAQLPPGVRIETTYHEVQVDPVAPGVAVVSALFESTFAGNDGMAFSFSGALTLVWAHEPDGWKIRSGHSSNPVPRR